MKRNSDEVIQHDKDRGIVGHDPTAKLWHFFDAIDLDYVPWKQHLTGSPDVLTVWRFISKDLQDACPLLYHHLKALMNKHAAYNYINFNVLR
jgi:hypothetical protein